MADQASVDARADFIAKTYFHLTAAVFAFAGLIAVILNTPALAEPIISILSMPYGAIILMVGFIAVSYAAQAMARSSTSVGTQYMGLGLYVVAEAVIFTPLLYVADQMGGNIIPTAGFITLAMFGAMTAVVFMTRKNFSFMAPALTIASFAALGVMICAMLFGFALGPIFTVVMIALACGYILYDTSNVLHEYQIGQHVAAALALFASVALLFWYVIRLVMSLQSRD
jgi:FtsH-binding integral membrane protein